MPKNNEPEKNMFELLLYYIIIKGIIILCFNYILYIRVKNNFFFCSLIKLFWNIISERKDKILIISTVYSRIIL